MDQEGRGLAKALLPSFSPSPPTRWSMKDAVVLYCLLTKAQTWS